MYIYIYIYIWMYVRTHTHTNTHLHTCTHRDNVRERDEGYLNVDLQLQQALLLVCALEQQVCLCSTYRCR